MIDVEFSHTKLIPSRVIDVLSNRRVSRSSQNEDGFAVKESDYVFNAAPSDVDNHTDTHVFGRNYRVYFTTSKRCNVSPFLPDYSDQLVVPVRLT